MSWVPVEDVVEGLEPAREGVSELFGGEPCGVYVDRSPDVLFDVICNGDKGNVMGGGKVWGGGCVWWGQVGVCPLLVRGCVWRRAAAVCARAVGCCE